MWIATYSGRKVYPLDIKPEDIDLADIAHALALKCRFNGHVRQFYSVAQHSWLVALEVPVEDRAWGLLHDAAEAYLPDIAAPIKDQMPLLVKAEQQALRAMADVFRLPWPIPESIHAADLRLVLTEGRDLLPGSDISTWGIDAEPLEKTRICPLPPEIAEFEFMFQAEQWLPTGSIAPCRTT